MRIRRVAVVQALLSLLLVSSGLADDPIVVGADSAVDYLLSCRKPNGAFGPIDQHYTDAAWNYPAVAALTLLGHKIEGPEGVLENGLGYPDGHVGYGHWQFFHYHQIRSLLGKPITPVHRRIELEHQGFEEIRYYGSPFGTDPDTFFKGGNGSEGDPRDEGAEKLGYYNLSSLYYLLEGLKASGREPVRNPEFAKIILRRAFNGGFADQRSDASLPLNGDTHVVHTFHALSILEWAGELGRAKNSGQCARFLQSCQDESGGFRWHPDESIPGNRRPDIYYTWAAVKALVLLGEKPKDETACRVWINSLQNADGGFGDRPGWRSRLYSTWYAVDALASLAGGDVAKAIERKKVRPAGTVEIPAEGYRIFQGLHKMPVVETKDLEGLLDRGFNLLALKSDDFTMADSLREEIRKRDLPMDIVLCPEAYPHRALRYGGAILHHLCNPTLDPRWTPAQRSVWKTADAAGAEGLVWSDYQEQVIRPLRGLGSLVYPEQDFEMEYAYSAYDAGLGGEAGYNAILAGFNWAPRDFIRVFPWRERYIDKLTPVADCDAHGDLKKWSPQLDHCRHLFIAKGPSYREFQEAARNGRVVCVIRNPEVEAPPATFYGSKAAVSYVRKRMEEWKWW